MGKRFNNKMWIMGLLLAVGMTGCGDDGASPAPAASTAGSAANSSAATRGAVSLLASAVPLGSAGNYAILAKTGVKSIPISVVTGNVGVSPAARGYLTGWSLITEPTDTSFSSAQVSPGKLYAADNVGGTTTVELTAAVSNMEAAYDAAVAKTTTNLLTVGELGGSNLTAGVYKFSGAMTITPSDLTLTGSATDVWVFQVGTTFDVAAGKKVTLAGGALPQNVFWQVAGAVTVGATAHVEGIILAKTAITFGNKATIKGRLLAQSAVVIDATTVTVP